MPIHDRNLKAGATLIGKYHKQSYKCEVVEVEGKLRFRLEEGREFKSPSAAGMAITGHPCDGWVFWSVQDAEDAAAMEGQQTVTQQEPAELIASTPEVEAGSIAEAPPTTPIFFKMEWRRGQYREVRPAGTAMSATSIS